MINYWTLLLAYGVWCGLTLSSLKSFLPKGMWSALWMAAFSPGDRNSIKLAYFHVRRNISFKCVLNCSETRWLGAKGWGKGESAISGIQKKGPWQRNFLLVKMAYLCKYPDVPSIVLQLYFLSTVFLFRVPFFFFLPLHVAHLLNSRHIKFESMSPMHQ